MSSEAIGWTFRHSPYRGASFAVHLAIADSVNDQNDNELWARQKWLAAKARTTRQTVNVTLSTMIDDALLELLDEGTGGANRYRFLMPTTLVDHFAKLSAVATRLSREASGVSALVTGGVSATATQNPSDLTQEEPKVNASTSVDVTSTVDELVALLASRIERHRGGDKPIVTARWRNDMRLLLERGPLHVDGAEPQPPDKVRASIDAVFDALNVPDGRSGFCWADQIRSPHALRDHWTQLRQAYRQQTGTRVGRGAQSVDRVAHRLASDAASSTAHEPLGLLVEHEPKELGA